VTNDLKAISAVAKEFDKLVYVDAISSLGCIDLQTDAWKCDIVVTGSQKGFMVPPGLAMISINEKAWQAHAKAKMPRYYWDLSKAKRFLEEKKQTPFTPAVSVFYGLAASLDILLAEGLNNVFARHARIAKSAREGAKALGLSLFPEEKICSDTITAIKASENLDATKLLQILRDEYKVVLSGGQGKLQGKIFRIGHVGWVTEKDMKQILQSLKEALPKAS